MNKTKEQNIMKEKLTFEIKGDYVMLQTFDNHFVFTSKEAIEKFIFECELEDTVEELLNDYTFGDSEYIFNHYGGIKVKGEVI